MWNVRLQGVGLGVDGGSHTPTGGAGGKGGTTLLRKIVTRLVLWLPPQKKHDPCYSALGGTGRKDSALPTLLKLQNWGKHTHTHTRHIDESKPPSTSSA